MRTRWLMLCAVAPAALAVGASARASETATYTYDALGRLVKTTRAGGPSSGVTMATCFDSAGNRMRYDIVAGTPTACPVVQPTPTPTPPPSFNVEGTPGSNVTVEGGQLLFTVTKTGATPDTFTVNYTILAPYATATGVATFGSDFTPVSGTLTFLPNETTKTFAVTTIDDSILESNETISAGLTSASGDATIVNTYAVGTIVDNDGPPAFAITNSKIVNEGGGLVYTVTKTGAASTSYSVNFATGGGTATPGTDYAAASGTLTFLPTETSQTITVVTNTDSATESNETVLVNLSAPSGNSVIAKAQGSGIIVDSHSPLVFAISDAPTVTEGGTFIYPVSSAGGLNIGFTNYTVNYTSASGTATSGADFTPVSGTLTFWGAQSSAIVVVTNDDTVAEPSETVLVTLSSPSGDATIAVAQASGIINDNEAPVPGAAPSFAIGNASVTEGGTLAYTVTKSGAVTGTYSVNFATASGTAASGTDFTAQSGMLSFLSNETTKVINVPTINDTAVESNETVLLNLSSPSGGATITAGQGTGTIIDNDAPNNNLPPVTTNDTFSVQCHGSGTANLTANDSDPENNVPLVLQSISATGGDGNGNAVATISSSSSVQIAAGDKGQTVFTYVVADSLGASSTGQLTFTATGNINFCTGGGNN